MPVLVFASGDSYERTFTQGPLVNIGSVAFLHTYKIIVLYAMILTVKALLLSMEICRGSDTNIS